MFVPITLQTAKDFVKKHHRHSKPTISHKFSIGWMEEGDLIGIATVGRPISRHLDDGLTAEILRVCVLEDKPNICSKLYSRAARIAQMMGYQRVISYTLQRETGSCLKGANFRQTKLLSGETWNRPNRERENQEVYSEDKIRWEYDGVKKHR